jgi:hypothetical protein
MSTAFARCCGTEAICESNAFLPENSPGELWFGRNQRREALAKVYNRSPSGSGALCFGHAWMARGDSWQT